MGGHFSLSLRPIKDIGFFFISRADVAPFSRRNWTMSEYGWEEGVKIVECPDVIAVELNFIAFPLSFYCLCAGAYKICFAALCVENRD